MFGLPVTPTSESSHSSLTVLLDPDNVGEAVGISLLSHIQAEIYAIAYELPVSLIYRALTSDNIHNSLTVLLDSDNMG